MSEQLAIGRDAGIAPAPALPDSPHALLLGLEMRTWLLMTALLAVAGTHILDMILYPNIFDDSYMFYRYALNVRAGLGIAWNPDGVQTYGLTSHLWLPVILAFSYLPFGPDLSVKLASTAAGLLAIAVMALALQRHARSRWIADPVTTGSIIALGLFGHHYCRYHLITGMDTMLAMATHGAIVLAVLDYLKRPSMRAAVIVGGAGFAAVLARPESGLCALGVPALAFLANGQWRRWRDLAGLVLLPAALIGVELAVCWLVFGVPLPLGFYAKSFNVYAGFMNPENAVTYMLTGLAFPLAFWPLLAGYARRTDARCLLVWLVPVALTFVYLLTVRQVMGWLGRYYVPFLPYVVVPALLLLDRSIAEGETARALLARLGKGMAIVAAVMIAALIAGPGLEDSYKARTLPQPIALPRLPVGTSVTIGRLGWLQTITVISADVIEPLPAGAVVAASEIGFIGAKAPHVTLIDLVGLNDTTIARHGFSMAGLLARKPDLIWMPASDYTGLRAKMFADPLLYREYAVYTQVFDDGIAIRRGGPHEAKLRAGIARGWAKLYPGRAMDDFRVRLPATP